MEKTSVEWIEEYLKKFNHIEESLSIRKAIEKAKEMEKQQIMDAWVNGGSTLSAKNAEQYYNEKFK